MQTRQRALVGPGLVAAAGAAAVLLLHVRDPHVPGAYGFCPFYLVTGWWCPGCGGLRAVHELTDGRLTAALGENAVVLVAVAVAVLVWLRRVVGIWRGQADLARPPSPRTVVAIAAICVGFAVVRNTPWGSWLAPS